MKEFNLSEFKDKNNIIAVHCKTKEEAEDFCKKMHEQGMKWRNGTTYLGRTKFDSYFDQMCYYGDGEYSRLKYAKEKGYEILEWSDYMQTEFTKADLKDGMVVHFDDGEKAVLVNDYYTTKNSFECVNGRLILKQSGRKVTKIEYGNEVVWELQSNKMTTEEMRKKLEELTGEKIEVEPSREEMIGTCYKYCGKNKCSECVLCNTGNCNFKHHPIELLKQCYEKVMEDGRKES